MNNCLTTFYNNGMPSSKSVIDHGRYEHWNKLIRVTAYVLRFSANLMLKKHDCPKVLPVDQIANAECWNLLVSSHLERSLSRRVWKISVRHKAGERQPRAPGQIGEHAPLPRPSWLSRWWPHQSLFFNRNQRGNRQRITCKKSPENFGADDVCGVYRTSRWT